MASHNGFIEFDLADCVVDKTNRGENLKVGYSVKVPMS
jgi:hypothetical protein